MCQVFDKISEHFESDILTWYQSRFTESSVGSISNAKRLWSAGCSLENLKKGKNGLQHKV